MQVREAAARRGLAPFTALCWAGADIPLRHAHHTHLVPTSSFLHTPRWPVILARTSFHTLPISAPPSPCPVPPLQEGFVANDDASAADEYGFEVDEEEEIKAMIERAAAAAEAARQQAELGPVPGTCAGGGGGVGGGGDLVLGGGEQGLRKEMGCLRTPGRDWDIAGIVGLRALLAKPLLTQTSRRTPVPFPPCRGGGGGERGRGAIRQRRRAIHTPQPRRRCVTPPDHVP